jgi:putative membrane protein
MARRSSAIQSEIPMRNIFLAAAATAALFSVSPASAQMMSPVEAGVSPLSGTSGTDYVKMAADADNFEIQSGRIAAMKSKRADIKGFAKQMVADHSGTSKSLMAALNNQDRKITAPSMKLSAANQAKIDLLRKAPKNSFDQIYLSQQLEAHQSAWALQKGYATDGTDPSLKQVAATAVPIIEGHLSMVKAMSSAAM